MADVPTNRTLSSTPTEHLSDHTALATAHNNDGWGAWTELNDAALSGTWVNSSGIAGYRLHHLGEVQLKGHIGGGTLGTAAFTLPTGHRPEFKQLFACISDAFSLGAVTVNTTGTVVPETGGADFHLTAVLFDSTGGT